MDGLGAAGLTGDLCTELTYANLAAVWSNFARAGVTRLLLAEAVETADELARIRAAIPDSTVVVCRLTATVETMQRRLRTREPGMLQQTFLARARELDAILEQARLEDFCVANDNGSVTDVAAEVLKIGRLARRSEAADDADLRTGPQLRYRVAAAAFRKEF